MYPPHKKVYTIGSTVKMISGSPFYSNKEKFNEVKNEQKEKSVLR